MVQVSVKPFAACSTNPLKFVGQERITFGEIREMFNVGGDGTVTMPGPEKNSSFWNVAKLALLP